MITSYVERPHPGAVWRGHAFGLVDASHPRETGGAVGRHDRDVILKAPLLAVALLASGLLAIPVVIGGNGSQTGAFALSQMGVPVVGVASTIDNDLYGSDITIGVDTALNIALEAIDRLKTTASSHQRAFLVEVMGRHCGYLALMAGLTGGAEVVVIPEAELEPWAIAEEFRKAYQRGKAHAIGVVAEGARNNAAAMARHFAEHHDELGFDLRVTTLGHVQRGGAPGAFDPAG